VFVFSRDAESDDLVDDEEQDQCAEDGDTPGHGNACKLIEHLAPMAVDRAGGHAFAEGGIDDHGGEEAGENRAERAACTVNPEGIEGVVVAEPAFDFEDHEGAKGAGDDADEERGERLDEAGGRRDGDEACDSSGDGTESGGFAVVDPLSDGPAKGSGGGSEVGVDEGAGGERTGAKGAAGIEAEPADPEQAGSDKAEDHGVGRHVGVGITEAFAEIDGGDERGDAGSDVDDGAAGEVERGNVAAAGIEESADAPDHVGHGAIDEQRPEGEKDGHGAELHAFGEGAGDERRRDDGKHELVDHVGLLGDGGGVVGVGSEADAAQEDVFEAADEGVAVAEGEGVAADRPEDGDEAHHGKALHHGGKDVFAPYEAAVEERETGAGHEENERGRDKHPGVVCVPLGRLDLLLEGGDLGLRGGCLGKSGSGGKQEGGEEQQRITATAHFESAPKKGPRERAGRRLLHHDAVCGLTCTDA